MPEAFGPIVASVRRVDPSVDAVALAEALWLGATIGSSGTSIPRLPATEPITTPPIDGSAESPQMATDYGGRQLYDLIPAGSGTASARQVGVGRAGSLPRSLELARALRPFKRPWPAGRRLHLDMDATVQGFAETGELVPVFAPEPERWYEAALVLDDAPGMVVWDDIAREFQRLLGQVGAFRLVRTWHLVTGEPQPTLRNPSGRTAAVQQLCAADARRMIFVFSDCARRDWQEAPLWRMLRLWSQSTATALVNPLSAKYWNHIGLDLPTTRVYAAAPGSRNAAQGFVLPPLLRALYDSDEQWVPLPVLALTPHALHRFASMLMRSDPTGCAAILMATEGRLPAEVDDEDDELPGAEGMVTSFLRMATPPAARLAVLCAAYPQLSLPVFRLIAARMVPEAGVMDIGEVIAGGLLDVSGDRKVPILTFRHGVREQLQQHLGADDVWRMYEVLSRHVDDNLNAPDRFPVAMHDPEGEVDLPKSVQPFALASTEALRVLGVGAVPTLRSQRFDASGPVRASEDFSRRASPRGTSFEPAIDIDSGGRKAGGSTAGTGTQATQAARTGSDGSPWGPIHQGMTHLLVERPADVPGVVDHLTKLQDLLVRLPPLEAANPLADFNKHYLTITTSVLDGLHHDRFNDPVFLSRLDVELAHRYFDALRYWTELSPHTPKAWSGLFERMREPDTRPLPSAAAGLNAHINYDLPFALVATFDSLESEPVDGSEQHRDYLEVNNIFAEKIPGLRRGYLDNWQIMIDMLGGEIDDWYQGELVEYTRNVAWRNAQKIWRCRHDPEARECERTRLDDNTALLGRLLLSPLGTFLQ